MSPQRGRQSEALDRAAANLLRLASSDIKDAELLAAGRNPENAPLLLHIAYCRLLEAAIASEQGWPVPAKAVDIGQLPNENPLKLAFARLSKMTKMPESLSLSKDGSIPRNFVKDGFRQDVAGSRKLLQALAEKFRVDLLHDTPAQNAVPVRPPAALEQKPSPAEPQSKPKLASSAHAPSVPSGSSAKMQAKDKIKPSPIVISDSLSQRGSGQVPHKVEGRSPMESPPRRRSVTSAAFWGLMDRWEISDLDALRLIGHTGGLSKTGATATICVARGRGGNG